MATDVKRLEDGRVVVSDLPVAMIFQTKESALRHFKSQRDCEVIVKLLEELK